MDCREVIDRLSDLEDGSLPEAAENEIRRHLLECTDCPAVARSLEAVREELRRLPLIPAPPELLERIHEAIAQETAGSTATSAAGAKSRSTGSRWKFPFGAAAALLLFASIGWYMAGSVPGSVPRPAISSSPSSVSAPVAETATSLPQSEPPSAAATPANTGDARRIQEITVSADPTPVQVSQAISEPSLPGRPTAHARQGEIRSIATLPEGISDPQIRVYSLADLPAIPVLRASTRFTRIQPSIPRNISETRPASSETSVTPEPEPQTTESQTAPLRPLVPYGRELSAEVAQEEREDAIEQIVRTAQRLGGTIEEVDRAEETITVRVLLPERTASAFIDELWRNEKLSPEGMPPRSVLPVGPAPGTIAYAVRLYAH